MQQYQNIITPPGVYVSYVEKVIIKLRLIQEGLNIT